MNSKHKRLRYYYWIILEFTKKHAKLILLSFLLSIVVIISIVSLSPYFLNYTSSKVEVIGLVGKYDYNNLPDDIISKVSNGLIVIDEKGTVIPILAESWEQIDNGKEYRFKLKKNLYWNDGTKFISKDITYKFKDVTVETPDDYQIIYKLTKPLPIFPTYLTAPIIKYPLVGVAGLYKSDRIKTKFGNIQELYFSPNKDGLPSYVYKFYDDETKLINAYKLSEINQMTITRKTLADTFTSWKNTQITKSVDYSRLMTLFFNMNQPKLKEDKDIRQAIAMAIHREKLADQGQEANGPIPPISWAYNADLKMTQMNPDLAEKILKKTSEASESGLLHINTSYENSDIAESIKDSLQAIGLPVRIDIISFEQPSSFDMLLAYWKVPIDPDQYYFWHSTQSQGNITNYKNVKVDKLLEDGRSTISVADRRKIYFQFQKVIVDDMPADFLFYPYVYTIKRK